MKLTGVKKSFLKNAAIEYLTRLLSALLGVENGIHKSNEKEQKTKNPSKYFSACRYQFREYNEHISGILIAIVKTSCFWVLHNSTKHLAKRPVNCQILDIVISLLSKV